MDVTLKNQVRSLLLKGFNKDEIAKVLNIKEEDIDIDLGDINKSSADLYSELQRDLTKLVSKELDKGDNSDSNVILNSIKLQAELQEKKLLLNKRTTTNTQINKSYIRDRDEEIVKLSNLGKTEKEIAQEFGISILSIKQAIERVNAGLPEHLLDLNPSIISETSNLDKTTRWRVLQDAFDKQLTRKEVRELVNKIKNETR